MKKFLLLTLIMCLFGGLSSSLMAQFNLTYNQGAANQYTLTFTPTSDNECAVQMNKGNAPGASTDLVIPATVENNGQTYNVVSIPNNAFSGASSYIGTASDYFTSLTIPNTVVSIGSYAFRYWSNCTTVILGEGVTSISNNAFANSSSITTIYCYANTPPTYGRNAVFHTTVRNNAKVYVPANSLNEYKKEATSGSGVGWAYININNFYAMSSTPALPDAPTLTSPTNGATDIFNPSLNFTLSSNTTHYQVLIAEANGTGAGDYTPLTSLVDKTNNTVSYQTSNLKPNTTYYWYVVATNDEGSAESAKYSFTTSNFGAPGIPTLVSPANNATIAENPNLSWNFGEYTEQYQVWLGTDADNLELKQVWTSTLATSYQTNNLAVGDYFWKIVAKNHVGETSSEVFKFTKLGAPDNVTPNSPADGATEVSNTTIRFTFAPNTTHYRFLYGEKSADNLAYCGHGTATTWLETGGATEMEITAPDFGIGTTYYWAVDVKNGSGQRTVHQGGDAIEVFHFTTSSIAAATNLGNTLNNREVTLTWSYGDGNTVDEYQVLLGTDQNNLEVVQDWTSRGGLSEGSFIKDGLDAGTTYYWQVNVRKDGGDALSSEIASFTTDPLPGAPTLNYPSNNEKITSDPKLSWTFGENTIEYQLLFGKDSDSLNVVKDWATLETSYQTSDLSANVTYYWQVNVRNNMGEVQGAVYSFIKSIRPDNVTPNSPVHGATEVSSKTIRFTFAPNTTHYRFLYGKSAGTLAYCGHGAATTWLETGGATEMEITAPDFETNTTYYWAVDVKNDLGQRSVWNGGGEIAIYSFTVSSILPVKYTSPIEDQITDINPSLTWTYQGDASQYQVLLGTTNPPTDVVQDWTNVSGTNGSYQASGLQNEKYYWQVNVKSDETTVNGEVMSFVSLKKPSFVNNVINVYPVSNIETSASIQLNGIPYSIGADSYNIYVDGSLLEENLASDSYTLNGINYNGGNPYVVKATAVYEGLGESLGSEPVNVYVSGYASVAGTITGVSGAIEGATIQYVGTTALEADDEKTFTFKTDAKGQFSGNIPCGTYTTTVSAEKYNNATREGKNFGVAIFDSENVTLTPIIPDNVTPISPADGATGVTSKIIKFQFAEGTTGYRFLYGEAEDQLAYCGYGAIDKWLETNGAKEIEIEAPYFSPGTTYYWAVDVRNDLGQRSVHEGGEEITIYSFKTSSVAAATYKSPVNGAILDQTSATLNWKYNHNGDAQYQVLAGTDSENLEVKQDDWTAAEGTVGEFTLSDLIPNKKYYWQVNVKNNEGTAEGEIWWFASLENPTMTNESNIYPVNKVEITWNEIAEASSYNVYSKENETETLLDNVSEGRYEFSPNQDTYTFVVKAVYDGIGESTGSTSTINISKFVDVECNVANNLNNNQVVENATIKFIGITTLDDAFEQTFTTDSNGTFSGNIPCGVYDIKVSADRYLDNNSLTDLDLASGKTYTYSIKLEPELPGNVTPISPADSATNVNNPTIVSWEFAKNTTQYRVLISDDTTNFRYVNGGEWLDVENEECSFPTDNLGLITGQQVWWCVDVKNDLNAVRSFWNSENKPALYNFTLSDQVSVNCTSPTQNEVLNNTDVTLQWNYGKGNNVTHYKVSLWDCNGTELLNQDWTKRATDGTGLVANGNYTVSLDPTMKYAWRVDVKKNEDGEVIEGKLMSFITPLEVPSISTESHNIYTANTNIEWNNTGNHVNGYNIYLNDILYNNELTKTNSYEVTDLTRNIEEGHKIQVTAIYNFGDENNYESNKSDSITVKVIGYANISGFVKNTNGNGIEGATIKFTGIDAFKNEQKFSTESDKGGAYKINIPEGTYVRTVEKEGYFNDTIKSKEYAASNITNDITLVSSAIFTVDVNASINNIDIRLSNNNWPDDANFSGSYNIYYKEDNDDDDPFADRWINDN